MALSTHSYKNPTEYSQHNQLQFEFAMSALSSIHIPSQARILDLGCGDGRITHHLANLTTEGRVVGTDISQHMTAHASTVFHDVKNLGFMQMDASQNIFRNQFDVVTSFNCLHWVQDQAAALRGIANAATENASILLLLSHKKSLYHHTIDSICQSDKWKKDFTAYSNPRCFFSVEEYSALLENAGLQIAEITEKEMSHHFDNSQALKAFFSSCMSQVSHLPIDKKSEFLTDFTNTFEDQLHQQGIFTRTVTFWCLQVNAIKPVLELNHLADIPALKGIKPI